MFHIKLMKQKYDTANIHAYSLMQKSTRSSRVMQKKRMLKKWKIKWKAR